MGSVLNVNADDAALRIQINHQTILNFAGINARARVQIDIERIGFLVVMKFHSSTRLRSSDLKVSIRERIVEGFAVREGDDAQNPPAQLGHNTPKSNAPVRLNHLGQRLRENPLTPF
ncbi:MAG: hypothetical protein AUG07_02285 [Acidobacteria bacterium 13_1_20CM_2_60_10]|nr:MAG: hypothetical protein AUG07_02285 [Acidobacteria bacterium 13_1_20CM_2_60_10]